MIGSCRGLEPVAGTKPGRVLLGQILPWLLLLACALLLVWQGWLWRLDHLLYDTQLRFWSAPPPDDVVIVGIDETSLQQLGRWPWSWDRHARLIERLTAAGAKAIAIDLILAESAASNAAAEARLAAAIRRNGRVVLPVFGEQTRLGGYLVETLPVKPLTQSAAALGHIHVEPDRDGLVRSVFLQEGLGSAYWPGFSLALLSLAQPDILRDLPGERPARPHSGSPVAWARDHRIFIPYGGPLGHFKRISYHQVLQGNFPPDTFRDKFVFLGLTAIGFGDALPTPVSGHTHSMPGVEIHAHIFEALRKGIDIRRLGLPWVLLLTSVFVVLPGVLFAYLTPRWNLVAAVGLLVSALLLSFVLLRWGHYWFPPAVALGAVVVSYPLWVWRRLEHAMGFLNGELARLHEEQASLPVHTDADIHQAVEVLTRTLPVRAWQLLDAQGRVLGGEGGLQPPPRRQLGRHWQRFGAVYWVDLSAHPKGAVIGLEWANETVANAAQQRLLDELVRAFQVTELRAPRGRYELVQRRILQVQNATQRLRALRRFITDTVAQMPDGVMVIDSFGTVVLANSTAALYLLQDAQGDLHAVPLGRLLAALELPGATKWSKLIGKALLQREPIQVEARQRDGRDLLIHIVPLTQAAEFGGFIVSLTDISPLKASERRRAELLGFLSHDLRSPLVSILALLEIGKAKQPPPQVLELMARMEQYTHNTLALSEEFLQLARAESNENISFQDVDLLMIVVNAVEQVWAQAVGKQIEIDQQLNIDEAWIRADAKLVERALVNLINNAVKYSAANTTVTVSLDQDEDGFRVCVVDQGYGIAAEEIPRLFERFHRVQRDDAPKVRGAGLGLTLVKAVADRHSGRVEVRSELGQGSRFCLYLPPRSKTVQRRTEPD